MQVKEIMTKDFEMVNSSETLIDAAGKMKSLNVGVLPVREGNKIVGLLTDRDIVIRALAENRDARTTTVKDVMTSEIARCTTEDSVDDASRIMRENKVRRLLVVDNDGTPVGIVSLGDIAAKTESEQLAGQTLEHVSQPATPSR
jgi:CBS domain-containing protein